MSRFGAIPARDVLGLHPFEVLAENGDTLPLPDTDPVDGGQLIVGSTDAVYYLTNPAPITLGSPPVQAGAYAGQRIQLVSRTASVTLPIDPLYPVGPLIVSAGTSAELVWDPGTGWLASGRTQYTPAFAYVSRITSLVATALPGAGPPTSPAYPGSLLYMSLGTSGSPILFPTGIYKAVLSVFLQVSSNNTLTWYDVFTNGQPSELLTLANVAFQSEPIGNALAQTQRGGTLVLNVTTPTNLWFDFRVAKGGGVGTVTYKQASIVIDRIG